MKIRLRTNQRVMFVGTTGSGKSELAKHFLQKINRVLVIDPKHTFRMDGYRISKNVPFDWFGFKQDDFHVIYRPRLFDDGNLAQLIYRLLRRKHITIYIDELATLVEMFKRSTVVLADAVRTGREKHISIWSATQRPRWIPRIFLTEAENIFQFQLRSEDDRRYMTGFMGAHVFEPIEEHNFWFTGIDFQPPALLRLDMRNHVIIQAS